MFDIGHTSPWTPPAPAARIGTALIAAAASGQLGGLKGRTRAMVARTIIDRTGLAERVSGMVAKEESTPLRNYIDAASSEATERPFESNLSDLRKAIGPGR